MRSDPRSFPALQAAAEQPACAKHHKSVALSAKRRRYAHHLFAPGLNQQPLLRISVSARIDLQHGKVAELAVPSFESF